MSLTPKLRRSITWNTKGTHLSDYTYPQSGIALINLIIEIASALLEISQCSIFNFRLKLTMIDVYWRCALWSILSENRWSMRTGFPPHDLISCHDCYQYIPLEISLAYFQNHYQRIMLCSTLRQLMKVLIDWSKPNSYNRRFLFRGICFTYWCCIRGK